jgi:hypothetical protein
VPAEKLAKHSLLKDNCGELLYLDKTNYWAKDKKFVLMGMVRHAVYQVLFRLGV